MTSSKNKSKKHLLRYRISSLTKDVRRMNASGALSISIICITKCTAPKTCCIIKPMTWNKDDRIEFEFYENYSYF
jgi:hypothetical protein